MGQLTGTNQVNSFPSQGRMNEDSTEDGYLSVYTMKNNINSKYQTSLIVGQRQS